jgi:peptide chain release factor 2
VRLEELNKLAEDPTLWDDQQRAQRLMQERTALEDQLTAIGRIERELDDQLTMIELGEAESDSAAVADAEEALRRLGQDVARRELEALLSGEADGFDTFLEVHAGAGGTESQDWANMLMRMYTR